MKNLEKIVKQLSNGVKQLATNQSNILEHQGQLVSIQEEHTNYTKRLIIIVEKIIGFVKVMTFMITITFSNVFLVKPVNLLITALSEEYSSLSEGYKIMILSLILGIPAMIIAQLIGNWILEKFKILYDKSI